MTTKDAQELHVPGVELRKLAGRGALQKVAYGLYRVPDIAPSRFDQLAEAVLRVGPDAYLDFRHLLPGIIVNTVNVVETVKACHV